MPSDAQIEKLNRKISLVGCLFMDSWFVRFIFGASSSNYPKNWQHFGSNSIASAIVKPRFIHKKCHFASAQNGIYKVCLRHIVTLVLSLFRRFFLSISHLCCIIAKLCGWQ